MVLSRRSLLASSAALALAPGLGHAQATRRGGVLRVAADSEYRNWNPAIAANNGVFLVARKVIEAIPDGRGVHMIDGKMQDDATWKQCRVMVDLAEMLARKDPDLAVAYQLP